ncbi:MAG: HAMP domain-containing protein [Magnetococcales bacterium]|nr:HAMP domain-containing protein [Magnetococcales bacterium]
MNGLVRFLCRILPGGLFGRLMVVLAGGMTLALLASAAIHFYDRGQALYTAGSLQTAQRIADVIQLLDPMSDAERRRVAAVLKTPLQTIQFSQKEPVGTGSEGINQQSAFVQALLERYLSGRWWIRVTTVATATDQDSPPPAKEGSSTTITSDALSTPPASGHGAAGSGSASSKPPGHPSPGTYPPPGASPPGTHLSAMTGPGSGNYLSAMTGLGFGPGVYPPGMPGMGPGFGSANYPPGTPGLAPGYGIYAPGMPGSGAGAGGYLPGGQGQGSGYGGGKPGIPAMGQLSCPEPPGNVGNAVPLSLVSIPLDEKSQSLLPRGTSFRIRVRFQDGTWAVFHNRLPEEIFDWPKQLLLPLSILLAGLIFISLLAVRLATRPLTLLAEAADALGRDIRNPPLAEVGSRELRQAAHAFNTMQGRLLRYVQERTQLLAALSHDLKTPITRMRLRTEMMDDGQIKEKTLHDLEEMEEMAASALAFIRGMEGSETSQMVDILAMLETIQAEQEEMGREVTVSSEPLPPVSVKPKSLKRCLDNLVVNAVVYGQKARLRAVLVGNALRITIADEGPGIPEADLGRVFEPFVRLEGSRNRRSGGTGLGLSIARNIARAHGGELVLKNGDERGLLAILTLPIHSTKGKDRPKAQNFS